MEHLQALVLSVIHLWGLHQNAHAHPEQWERPWWSWQASWRASRCTVPRLTGWRRWCGWWAPAMRLGWVRFCDPSELCKKGGHKASQRAEGRDVQQMHMDSVRAADACNSGDLCQNKAEYAELSVISNSCQMLQTRTVARNIFLLFSLQADELIHSRWEGSNEAQR